MILGALLGGVWGGWLGRREAAHGGRGLGSAGLMLGVAIGACIGLGIGRLYGVSVIGGVVATALYAGGTALVVWRY